LTRPEKCVELTRLIGGLLLTNHLTIQLAYKSPFDISPPKKPSFRPHGPHRGDLYASLYGTISFEDLFERRPQAGTKECDIVLSERELGGIARKVWKEMGFQV
jgi:hypothetical protein